MGEPLSALATCLGVMGNLMEVPSLMASRYRQMKDYEELIIGHYRRLEVCKAKLAEWANIWDENPQRALNTYRALWGTPATVRIIRRLGDIERRCIGIRQNIRIEADEVDRGSDARPPRAHIELIKTKRGRSRILIVPERVKKSLNLGSRLAFAFIGDERLGMDLDHLEMEIDGLKTISTYEFAKMGYIDHGQAPDKEYVKLCRKRIQMSRFLEALHSKCKSQSRNFEWTIDMRMPLDDSLESHLQALTKEARLDFIVRFSVKTSEKIERSATHLSITQVEVSSESLPDLADLTVLDFAMVRVERVRFEDTVYQLAKEEKPRRQFFCMRNLMNPIKPFETGPLQSEYRTDCAKFYVATTLWFIFSDKSGWFSHIDSSRVHCAHLTREERERFDVAKDEWKRYMYQPWSLFQGHDIQTSDELLSLGMLFGEVALGTRIRLLSEERGQVFIKEANSGNQAMSKEQLLRDIYFFGGKQVEAVVKYCLDDRSDGNQQGQLMLSMTRNYEDKILRP